MNYLLLLLLIISSAFAQTEYDSRPNRPRPAVNGVDGSDGSSQYFSGQHGQHGDNGGHATAPENAKASGDIDLRLKEVKNADGTFSYQVTGEIDDPEKGRVKVNDKFPIDAKKDIKPIASGILGEGGGIGGDGGDGGRGADGSASNSKYSDGGDAGNGGDGGNAGRGTPGGDAGDAGKVKLSLHEDDMHLLMMVDDSTEGIRDGEILGGKGGESGRHGKPGSGGGGGIGGSGYSWEEKDAEGKVTDSGSTRSGSNGWSGSEGSEAHGPLGNGKDGKNNKLIIEIQRADGKVDRYERGRYNMQITDIKYSQAETGAVKDNIIEPGEKINVKFEVQNNGNMPTPSKQKVRVVIQPNGNVDTSKAITKELLVPKSLAPGEKYVIEETLDFIATSGLKKGPVIGDAVVENAKIEPKTGLQNTGGRTFQDSAAADFEIKRPVRISRIEGNRTIMPGESTNVKFDVENLSSIDVGSDAKLKRALSTDLKFQLAEGLTSEDLIFEDESGKKMSLKEKFEQSVGNLKAKEKIEIKGKITLKPGVAGYSAGTVRASLNLGELNNHLVPENIQGQDIRFQVAQSYQEAADNKLILVTNNRTTKAEIEAWEETAKKMGLKLADYNLSYYGALDYSKPPLNKLKDATVILLNNEFDPLVGKYRPSEMLDIKKSIAALEQNNVKTYMVGDSLKSEDILGRMMNVDGGEAKGHKSVGSFVKDHKKGSSAVADNILGASDKVEVRQSFVWGKPGEKSLKDKAKKVASLLEKMDPSQRYVVVSNYTPSEETGFKSFFKEKNVGSISILRSPDLNSAGLVMNNTGDVASPDFIKSDKNIFGLMKTVDFNERLDMLDKLSDAELKGPTGRALYDSLASDLSEEQKMLRNLDWNLGAGGMDKKAMKENLPKLSSLAEKDFSRLDPTSEKWKLVSDLHADMGHMLKSEVGMWGKLIPFNRNQAVTKASESVLKGSSKKFGANASKMEEELKVKVAERQKHFKELKQNGKMARGDVLKAQLAPEARGGVASTADVNSRVTVMDNKKFEEIQAKQGDVSVAISDAEEANDIQRRINSGEKLDPVKSGSQCVAKSMSSLLGSLLD